MIATRRPALSRGPRHPGDPMHDTAEQLRAVLAAIDGGALAATSATRHRLEGAVMALDAVRVSENDRLCDIVPLPRSARSAVSQNPRPKSTSHIDTGHRL